MTAPLAEVVEEGRRLQERHQRACNDLDVEAALSLGHDLNLYYLKHGPRLLAVAEAGERLWDYAAHAPICVYPAKPCDCGLNEALAQWYAAARGEL